MSSHHFVREGQEPALIIANGASCKMDILNQLLEWNPYILILDGAIDRILELGIKFDAWLGDFDSSEIPENIKAQFGEIEIIHAPDQNKTDLQKGIEFIHQKGYTDANILWATGRRADHTFQNIATLPQYAGLINLNVIDDHSKVYNLPKKFKKWYPAKTKLSLFPITEVTDIFTSNLDYNLNYETLKLPHKTGSSNSVSADGFVEINHSNGDLILMECFD